MRKPEDRQREAALESIVQSVTAASLPHDDADCRVIIESAPQSGTWNMAVDEALLEGTAAGAGPVLRLYRWNEATVTLGYFQRETPELEKRGRFFGLPSVRRLSGGGAILHHHELTYSCCIPRSHRLADEPATLYDGIHTAIQETFAELGIMLSPRGEHEGSDKPFLCYARGDRRDLVYNNFKIVGSAQRRRAGAVLQHGSILLHRSAFTPEFPGLCDLTGTTLDEAALAQSLAQCAAALLASRVVFSDITTTEQQLAEQLQADRYTSPEATDSVKAV